jgi:hypothetical protein
MPRRWRRREHLPRPSKYQCCIAREFPPLLAGAFALGVVERRQGGFGGVAVAGDLDLPGGGEEVGFALGLAGA